MLLVASLTLLGLGTLATSASAGIWTPIASNTTEDITAIEYQGADRLWFTTGAGRIFKRVGGTFVEKKFDAVTSFKDIEFQPGGAIGLAVGTNGRVWRSGDSGDTWNLIAVPNGGNATSERCDLVPEPLGDVDSVRFDGLGNAWLMAGGSQIFRSLAGPAVGSTWAYMNGAPNCRIDQDIDDAFFVPGSAAGYFIARSFGAVWFTSNGLASDATVKPAGAGNGFEDVRRVAGDASNPNRQWAVTPGNGGISYFARTTDGWSTESNWTIGNPDLRDVTKPSDVDFSGGTVLVAGSAGMIQHSIDGATFFFNGADGALATQDWLSVGLASASAGAVGGTGGKLALTSAANVTPDVVPPTGTISGPATLVAGQSATFTAVLNDTGGSGLNAGATAWTVTGLGNQSGTTATYTFPSAGFYSLKVTFADNAGNRAEATLGVSVSAPASPTFSFSGSGNSATAKIIGSRVRVRMRGTVRPPAGVSVSAACNGKVRLTIKKKSKTLLKTRAKLKLKSGRCRFGKTVYIKRSKVGRATKLRLKVRFPGNAVLKAGSTTKTLVVRK